jgi:hypothetical protein
MLSRYCSEKICVRILKVTLLKKRAGSGLHATGVQICTAKSWRANLSDAAMTD